MWAICGSIKELVNLHQNCSSFLAKRNDGQVLQDVDWRSRFWLNLQAMVVRIFGDKTVNQNLQFHKYFQELTFISYCDVIWNIVHFRRLMLYIFCGEFNKIKSLHTSLYLRQRLFTNRVCLPYKYSLRIILQVQFY